MLRERSNNIASFVEHPVCSNFKLHTGFILLFSFWFATIYSKWMCKSHFFLNSRCSAKELMSLHLFQSTLYIAISKCLVSWYQVFYFDLSWSTQRACAKAIYICNFRCSTKENTILLLSRSTLHIAIKKCIVSWFYFFYFDFPLCTQNASIKFFLEILGAPRKEQWYCFFRGAACI